MKILHITTKDTGGAATAAIRIHEGLLQQSIYSQMLLLWKNKDNVAECYSYQDMYKSLTDKILVKYKHYKQVKRYNNTTLKNALTTPYRVHNHPKLEQADIIHLHWINNFVDYPTFFKNIDKPIIWTFHDMSPFTGGNPYEKHLNDSHKQTYSETLNQKNDILSNKNITGVATTSEFLIKAKESIIFNSKQVHLIPYGLDTSVFKPISRNVARDIFNLPKGKKNILFVSADVSLPRKGIKKLIDIIPELLNMNCILTVVGKSFEKYVMKEGIYNLGYINDERLLAAAYASADVFVTPALEEAFGQTTIEALAIGIPVVAFPTAGSKDILNSYRNGIICDQFDSISLLEGIKLCLNSNWNSDKISEDAQKKYSISVQAKNYIDLYKSTL